MVMLSASKEAAVSLALCARKCAVHSSNICIYLLIHSFINSFIHSFSKPVLSLLGTQGYRSLSCAAICIYLLKKIFCKIGNYTVLILIWPFRDNLFLSPIGQSRASCPKSSFQTLTFVSGPERLLQLSEP